MAKAKKISISLTPEAHRIAKAKAARLSKKLNLRVTVSSYIGRLIVQDINSQESPETPSDLAKKLALEESEKIVKQRSEANAK